VGSRDSDHQTVFYSKVKELFASVEVEMLLEYTLLVLPPHTDIAKHPEIIKKIAKLIYIKHTAVLENVSRYWKARRRILI
jgi:hypothetical protein